MKGIIIVLSLLMMSQTKAYNFTQDFSNGYYWNSLPITLHVNDDALYQHFVAASEVWERQVGTDIWTIEKGNGPNQVRWSSNLGGETGYDPQNTLAVTIRNSVGTHMKQVMILFNRGRNDLVNNQYNTLYKTVLHELGHTVGLGHSDHQAIMAPSISYLSQLQNDDLVGMNAVVDTTHNRQSTGYVSHMLSNEGNTSSAIGTCGTLHLINESGNGPPSGGSGFIVSLFAGLLLSIYARRFRFVSLQS